MNGVGNTQFVAEFNFYGDPEGARIVLDEYTSKVNRLLTFYISFLVYDDNYNLGSLLCKPFSAEFIRN